MNDLNYPLLRLLRKVYRRIYGDYQFKMPYLEKDPDKVSKDLYDLLSSDKPCMIGRFGCTELACISNYLSIKSSRHNVFDYIKGKQDAWWWKKSLMIQSRDWSGIFPSTEEILGKFCELMLEDMNEVDYLGGWDENEVSILSRIERVPKSVLGYLEPFFVANPWSRILEGKKVLVVHPFVKTIKKQYENRDKLFKNKLILPKFDLITIKAVQSIGGNCDNFDNWFDALNYMKNEIDKTNYDIALIGCGAYGFPLAAYVKRMGKKSVHLGGSLQLLFGIKGKRWEDKLYGSQTTGETGLYTQLINEYWVRPDETEKPINAINVENGCYW